MGQIFLFRLDGSRDNDAFLDAARVKEHVVYSGISLSLDRGWIPDFVEVEFPEEGGSCRLTLVELEATENLALVSARKYLPESSRGIASAFLDYLGRVLDRCRSTADPRTDQLRALSDRFSASAVEVWTAAATRQPPDVLERLPLSDQDRVLHAPLIQQQGAIEGSTLDGELALSPRVHKNVSRSVLILDAVVRGWDKSDAILRAWRNLRSQPLRGEIAESPHVYPALGALLLGGKTGVRITINDAARELARIWNRFEPGHFTEQSVLAAISQFMPIDRALDTNASVRAAFEKARPVLAAMRPNER